MGEKLKMVVEFFTNSWMELKKVKWLGRKELIQSSIFVIAVVLIFSIYIAGVDFILSRLIGIIL